MLADYVRARDKKGFDAAAYAATHRDLLSFGFDMYLIVLALNAKGTDEEQQDLIDATRVIRVELFDIRNRHK